MRAVAGSIVTLSSFLLYAKWIGLSVIMDQINPDYDLTMHAELSSKLCAKRDFLVIRIPWPIEYPV